MNFKKFAAITISFSNNLDEDILQDIENKLRESKNINNFSPNSTKLTFTIQGEEDLDYKVIGELKALLNSKKKSFKVTADEYTLTSSKEF